MSPEPGEGGSSRKTTTASIAMRGTLPDFPPPLLRYTPSLKPSPQHRWKSTKPEATTARQAGSGGFHALHTFKHTHRHTNISEMAQNGKEQWARMHHLQSSPTFFKKGRKKGKKTPHPTRQKNPSPPRFFFFFSYRLLAPPSSRLQERNFNLDQGQAHFTPSPSYNVPSSTQ